MSPDVPEQIKLLERTRTAARYHRELSKECERAGLRILSKWHESVASEGLAQVELQLRAMRKEGLAKEE